MDSESSPIVLFDGDCDFCTACAVFAYSHVQADAVYLPYQWVDLTPLGLTVADVQRSVLVVTSEKIVRSSEAVMAILSRGKWPYRLLAWLGSLPVMRTLAERGYWWVARHRGKFPGLPAPVKLYRSDEKAHENL